MSRLKPKRYGKNGGGRPSQPKPKLHRGMSSHYNLYGSPKVTHLTIESAEAHAAEIGGVVYRCELGCLHVGNSRRDS